jgi:hypothetical protein
MMKRVHGFVQGFYCVQRNGDGGGMDGEVLPVLLHLVVDDSVLPRRQGVRIFGRLEALLAHAGVSNVQSVGIF